MHLNLFCSIHNRSHKQFITNYVGLLFLAFAIWCCFCLRLKRNICFQNWLPYRKASTERTYITGTNIQSKHNFLGQQKINVQIVFAAYRLVSHTSKWFERGREGTTCSTTHTHSATSARVGWITLERTVVVIGTLCHIMEILSPVRALRVSSAWLKHNSISVWPLCNHSLFFFLSPTCLSFLFFCFFLSLCSRLLFSRNRTFVRSLYHLLPNIFYRCTEAILFNDRRHTFNGNIGHRTQFVEKAIGHHDMCPSSYFFL